MKNFLRLAIAALLLFSTDALASSGTLPVTPCASGCTNLSETVTAGTTYMPNVAIFDYAAGANGVSVTAAHELTIGGSGTAGTASTAVATIQGIASMTPVQVSQATAANLNATVTGSGTAGTPSTGVITIQGINGGTPQAVSSVATTSVVTAGTVTASSAYTTGNVVGGLISLSVGRVSGSPVTVTGVTLYFADTQNSAFDVLLFSANPSSSTFTDKAALSVNAADYNKIIPGGVIHIADCPNLGTPSVCQTSVNLPANLTATTLYAVIVTRATPVFGSTSDVSLGVSVYN